MPNGLLSRYRLQADDAFYTKVFVLHHEGEGCFLPLLQSKLLDVQQVVKF